MNRRFALAFVFAALLSGALPFATTARMGAGSYVDSLPGTKVIVRAGHGVKVPKPILAPLPARTLTGQPLIATANIEVAYTGFSPEAQAAFDAAVAVWESIIVSPKVIHVSAAWTPLGEGVLGSAGPTNFYRLPSGDRWYPAALYEAICNCESLLVTEIDADFNSAFDDWYLGTDGNAPADKYDLYSVVLHELGHGLGFVSSFRMSGSSGVWGYPSGGITYPFAFDLNEWSDAMDGNLLTNTSAYPNPSTALKTQLTDGSVYFGGANVMAANGGNRAPLYAPNPWDAGSSNSHFDEDAFPAGNQNALMTPYLDNGEVNHDPGPLTLALFQDIGWTLSGSAESPGPPVGVSALAGNAQATVFWEAPASDGGSPITGYTVTSDPGAGTCSATVVLNCTVTGLVNGTPYTFSVTATNAVGTGPASEPSAAVTPRTTPGAPTGVSAVAGNGQATVSWSAPESDGGSAIWFYEATSAPTNQTCTSFGPTSCTVTGLTNGQSYTFTVIATNAAGSGPASAPSGAVIPRTVPSAPTGVTATPLNAQAQITWTAPASNGGSAILDYTATTSSGGASCTTPNGSTTTCTISGLTNGILYSVSVKARNVAGSGPASSPAVNVTPRTVPGAPTGATGTPGNGSATVSWIAPASNGGSPITGYTVTSNPGAKTCLWGSGPLTCTVSGLTNGQPYTFSVVATNAAGDGPASAASNSVIPAGVPGAPTNVAATAGNTSATVSWTAPAANGSAITSYTVTSSPGAKACTTANTSCTVTGLTNGVAYTFTVVATNAAGDGPASAASNSVTPHAPAVDTSPPVVSAPVAVIVSVSSMTTTAAITISWPAATDASGIDHYTLQRKKGTGKWLTVVLPSPGATSVTLNLAPAKYTFRLSASDASANHNTSAWQTGTKHTLSLVQENATAVKYSGTWKRKLLSGSSGRYVKFATLGSARASYTFTGSSIGLVTTTGPAYGMAELWLDGVKQTTLDLYSATTRKKLIAWSPSAPLAPGSHTLELRVLGTKNANATGTRVDLDALLVWN